MENKVKNSYEIHNETVVFHLGETLVEAKSDEVAEKLEADGEVIVKDGQFHRFETFEVEAQYVDTFEQSKWLEVPVDEVEEAVLSCTSAILPEEKDFIKHLLGKMDATDEILYGSQMKGIMRKLNIVESVKS